VTDAGRVRPGTRKLLSLSGGAGVPAAWLALALVLSCLCTARLAPVFDPDEGYYPATARETLAAGSGWDLRFNGEPRWDKPVLSYALIEAAFTVLGVSVTSARVPSALQGAVLLLAVVLVVSRLENRRAGLLSGLVLGSALGVQIFSRVAHPEIAVVLGITASELLFCLWLSEPDRSGRPRAALLAGLAVGYGVLAKGPVAIVLPVSMAGLSLPFLGWTDRLRRRDALDAAVAGVVALLVAAPWYIAMTLRHGLSFLRTSLWEHNVIRYTTTTYGHSAGLLFFVIPSAALILPWTALAPGALGRAFRRRGAAVSPLPLGMLASTMTSFLFYSLSASKLANYALVLVPPIAILIGIRLDDALREAPEASRQWRSVTALLLFSIAAVLVLGPSVADRFWTAREVLGGTPPPGMSIAALARVGVPAGLVFAAGAVVVAAGSLRAGIAALATVGFVAPALLVATATPWLGAIYPWESFGRRVAASPAPVYLAGYRAPSLTFYATRPIDWIPITAVPDRLHAAGPSWLILDRSTWDAVRAGDGPDAPRSVTCGAAGRMVLVRIGSASCPR
jgi:4-amino-4-deoxy-L-arabinose transferase-like glycosyltransferase